MTSRSRGVLKDTSLLLNIENAFNRAPPFYNANAGIANGSTYGRLISVGIPQEVWRLRARKWNI